MKTEIIKSGCIIFIFILADVIINLVSRFGLHYLGWNNYYPSLNFPLFLVLMFTHSALIPLFIITAEKIRKSRYSRIIIIISIILSAAVFMFSVSGDHISYAVMIIITFIYLMIKAVNSRGDRKEESFLPSKRLLIAGFCFFPLILIDILKTLPVLDNFLPAIIQNCDFYPFYIIALCLLFISNSYSRSGNRKIPADNQSGLKSFQELNTDFSLTAREYEVLKLMISGIGNQKIEKQLFISASTVKKHINSIYRKLYTKNRWELIHLASLYSNS